MQDFYNIFLMALRDQKIKVELPELNTTPAELAEMQCYNAILKIRDILADETLEDPGCFYQIEEIVRTLENLGLYCGGRHDF